MKLSFLLLPFSFLLLLGLLLCGCSGSSAVPAADQQTLPKLQGLEIYISRGSLLGPTEFEQYKILGGKLFAECGKIVRERNQAQFQDLSPLAEDSVHNLSRLTISALESIEKEQTKFRKPGVNRGIFDPGQAVFDLNVEGREHRRIETSLDSISEPFSKAEERLKKLVENVRAMSANDCGNIQFFGLGKSSPS